MRDYIADLHLHTLLSPCASIEMTPRNIVYYAQLHGIDIIAITDHNASDNVAATILAAKETSVTILPGMEVETKEEVHLLTLFDEIELLNKWQFMLKPFYLGKKNDTAKLGGQFIVDAQDNLIAEKEEMLLCSLTISIEKVVEYVTQLGGIVIASHVDRPAYSILAQLGMIPSDIGLAAVEVSRRIRLQNARTQIPAVQNLPIVTASDAHYIKDFIEGPKTVFHLQRPTILEIKLALGNQQGRCIVI